LLQREAKRRRSEAGVSKLSSSRLQSKKAATFFLPGRNEGDDIEDDTTAGAATSEEKSRD
jgi:hypothetical protein